MLCKLLLLLLPFGVAAIVILFILLCLHFVLACHRPLGHLLSKGDHGIFSMSSTLSVFRAHEGESGIDELTQVWTGRSEKQPLHTVTSRSGTITTQTPVVTLLVDHQGSTANGLASFRLRLEDA